MAESNAQQAAIKLAIERRGTGVCVNCGSPDVDNPELLTPRCAACLIVQNERVALSKEKHGDKYNATTRELRQIQIQLGLCAVPRCQNNPAKGRKQCQDHIDYFAAATKRYKQKKAKK